MRRLMSLACAAGLFLCACSSFAARGELDPSFGDGGRVSLEIADLFQISTLAAQPDNLIIAAGARQPAGPAPQLTDFLVLRIRPDGTLDPNFSDDGMQAIDFAGGYDSATASALLPDGKILVTGSASPASLVSTAFAIARLNADGTLDTSFANGGRVLTAGIENLAVASSLLLQPDGKVVLAGVVTVPSDENSYYVLLTRFNADGLTDTGFGNNGFARVDTGRSFPNIAGIGRLSDGHIVVGGRLEWQSAVIRLTANGQIDSAWGTGGIVRFNVEERSQDAVAGFAVQPDDKIVLSGTWNILTYPGFIARLNPDGALDQNFGSGGRIVRNMPLGSLLLRNDGGLVAMGRPSLKEGNLYLLPSLGTALGFARDGSSDVAFGSRGTTFIDMGANDRLSNMRGALRAVSLADGRIVVAEESVANPPTHTLQLAMLTASNSGAGVISVRRITPGIYGPNPNTPQIKESGPSVQFEIRRSGGASGAATVQFAAVNGTAVSGEDFGVTAGTLSWADGEMGRRTVSVPIVDDNLYESASEQFRFELSQPAGGAVLGTRGVDVSIISDETTSYVGVQGMTVTEAAGIAMVRVIRSGDVRLAATVNYTTVAGNAQAPADFTPVSGTLNWSAGDGNDRLIAVPIVNDGAIEISKRFAIQLASTSPGVSLSSVNDFDKMITIEDDEDPSAGGSVFTQTPYSVVESAGSITLTLRRPDNGNGAMSYDYDVSASSGSQPAAGVDFTAVTGTLSWGVNDHSLKTIVVPILNDTSDELTEDLTVRIFSNLLTVATARIWIIDDDTDIAPPGVGFAQSHRSVNEADGTATLTLVRTGNVSLPASVRCELGTGTAGTEDFTHTWSNVSWMAGDMSPQTITVNLHNDSLDEIDETFYAYLTTPGDGVQLGRTSMTVTIVDDDATPAGQPAPTPVSVRFQQSEASFAENERYATVTMVREGSDVRYSPLAQVTSTNVTATAEDDFIIEPLSLFPWQDPPSPWTTPIRVLLNGDRRLEGNETFQLVLRSADGTPLADPVTITLTDDDTTDGSGPLTQFGIVETSASVTEGQASVTLTVARSGDFGQAATVNYGTANGSATAGSDFVAGSGTLQWAAGDSANKTVTVTLSDDGIAEGQETFRLSLSNPTDNATLGRSEVTITIEDNDQAAAPGKKGGGGGGSLGMLMLAALLMLWIARRPEWLHFSAIRRLDH